MTGRMIHILETFKNSLVNLIAIIFVFLTPIHGMLLTTSLFVIADTIFAIYVTVKLNGWESFRSAKLYNTVPKTVFYLSAICLGFLVDKFIVAGTVWGISMLITKIVCAFLIWIEVKSLDETSQKLGNRSFWQILKELITKAKDVKKDLNEIVEDKKDEDGHDNLG
jgi:hypothetical protein